MAQEAFDSSPAVREACAASIFGHAQTLEADLSAALSASRPTSPGIPSADCLAKYIQAVLQGAFVLAKAANDSGIVLDAIEHWRRYLECLLHGAPRSTSRPKDDGYASVLALFSTKSSNTTTSCSGPQQAGNPERARRNQVVQRATVSGLI